MLQYRKSQKTVPYFETVSKAEVPENPVKNKHVSELARKKLHLLST